MLVYGASIQKIKSTEEQIVLQFRLEDYKIDYENGFAFISSESCYFPGEPGEPMLPVMEISFALPENGGYDYYVKRGKSESIALSRPIAPVPRLIPDGEFSQYVYEIHEDKYSKLLTPELITAKEPTYWRHFLIGTIFIRPFRYIEGRLQVQKEFQLTININGNKKKKFSLNISGSEFERVYQNVILNYDIAKNWVIKEKKEAPISPFSYADRWFKIPITQDGIYKITKNQLKNAITIGNSGIDIDNLDPQTIRIFNAGGYCLDRSVNYQELELKEIPIYITGETDGSFDSGDAIYFYARDTDGWEVNKEYDWLYYNPYTPENIYWLTYNTGFTEPPKRMEINQTPTSPADSADSYLHTEHFESNNINESGNGFYWYWTTLYNNNSYNYNFNVDKIDNSKEQQITVRVQPKASGAQVKLYVNNILTANVTLSSSASEINCTTYNLKEGNNTLKINVSNNDVYLDYYEIRYYRTYNAEHKALNFTLPETEQVFEVTLKNVDADEFNLFKIYDFDNVKRINSYQMTGNNVTFKDSIRDEDYNYWAVSSGDYLIPSQIIEDNLSDLRTDTSAVDMVIITPEEFYEQSLELASFHRKYELESPHSQYNNIIVRTVKLQDVYDEFSWGLIDPVAIRNYMKYIKSYYNGELVDYLILVGDGSIDFRNYSGQVGNKNKLLPFQNGTVVSDDYFVYLTQTDRPYPEIGIGRLPCQTTSELQVIIDKIKSYHLDTEFGFWKDRVLYVADDDIKGGNPESIEHTKQAETGAGMLSSYVEMNKIYGIEYPLDEFLNKPDAREHIIAKINEGVVIFYYIGHGAHDLLGHEDYFRASRDIPQLHNKDKLHYFVAASCNVGHFDAFSYDSMAEKMLKVKDKGAIASFAATRGCSGESNTTLCNDMNKYIVNDSLSLGQAIVSAKMNNSGIHPNNRYYTLFGDPLTYLQFPERIGNITFPEKSVSLKARQKVTINGSIGDSNYDDKTYIKVYDTDYPGEYIKANGGLYTYTKRGNPIYRGYVSDSLGNYTATFIVPDDIYGGDKGRIIAYSISSDRTADAVQYYYPITIKDQILTENNDSPIIEIKLDTEDFTNGGEVSSKPFLKTTISDSNGINIKENPGHRILLTIDDDYNNTINITKHFVYDLNSYQSGTISYQLNKLSDDKLMKEG